MSAGRPIKIYESNKTVLEKDIEQKLVRAVKASGGICPKFVSPGTNGVPDRLVLMPEGRMAFVEVKAPGKKPRPLQDFRIRQLRDLGFAVYVLDGMAQIPGILEEISGQEIQGWDIEKQKNKEQSVNTEEKTACRT